jgi:ATP-dependent exoDNAse (exonuclease V) beta subunit
VDLDLPKIAAADVERAVANAGRFPRRTTPHTLTVHSRDEAEPEREADAEDDAVGEVSATSPGVLYGTWWHEFVETVPWSQPSREWKRKFTEAKARSPQPDRSTWEWELFCASELAKWLAQPDRLVQVELPFLWFEPDKPCLEGVMDLAVYSPREAEWQVIDWKTNKIAPGGGQAIVEIYREQIRAYVRALKEMLSAEVRGSLYLTQTGEWLPVD